MKKPTNLTGLMLQQNVLMVLLLTLVVIMLWVGFTIYFSYSKTTITPTDAQLIAPLSPKLDSKLFDTLKTRKSWSDDELNSFQTSIVVTTVPGSESSPLPTPKITIPSPASPSATRISTSSATKK